MSQNELSSAAVRPVRLTAALGSFGKTTRWLQCTVTTSELTYSFEKCRSPESCFTRRLPLSPCTRTRLTSRPPAPTPRAKGCPRRLPQTSKTSQKAHLPLWRTTPMCLGGYRGTIASQPDRAPDAPKTFQDVVGPHPTPSRPINPHADAPAQPEPPQTAPPHPHQAPPARAQLARNNHAPADEVAAAPRADRPKPTNRHKRRTEHRNPPADRPPHKAERSTTPETRRKHQPPPTETAEP